MMKKIFFVFLLLFSNAKDVDLKGISDKSVVKKEESLELSKENEFLEKTNPVVVAIQHENATGSGFIISEDGYILTNGHVVHSPDKEEPLLAAKRITVTLWNEEKYSAKVIGLSLDPDVALIKIDTDTPLKVASIGDSKVITTGEVCYAFGSPYGIKKTLTKGIISRAGLTDLQTFTKLFQIDAVINPGNSGGPLFNEEGKVIGINTYRSPKSGFGYSIPIHFAMVIKEHYLRYGRLIRSDIPYFFAKAMTQGYADYWQVPRGVFIDHVEKGSYAWQQGLRSKDIVVKMNDEQVSGASQEDFYDWIWDISVLPVGSTVKLTVIRQQRKGVNIEKDLAVVLKESDPLPSYGYQFGEIAEINYKKLGFYIQEINPLLWFMRDLPRKNGVNVSFVEKGSLAEGSGFRVNSVIYELNGKAIKNTEDFERIMNAELIAQKQYFIFKMNRGNDTFVNVLSPRYRIKDKKVLIISNKDNEYLPIYKKYLKIGGAQVTLSIDEKLDFKEDWDAIILSGISEIDNKLDKNIIKLLKSVDKEKVVLGGDRKSVLYFLEIDEFKSLKMTMDESLIAQNSEKKVNYTGEDIEKDENLITTTAIDRQTAQQYIITVIDSIYKNSFR